MGRCRLCGWYTMDDDCYCEDCESQLCPNCWGEPGECCCGYYYDEDFCPECKRCHDECICKMCSCHNCRQGKNYELSVVKIMTHENVICSVGYYYEVCEIYNKMLEEHRDLEVEMYKYDDYIKLHPDFIYQYYTYFRNNVFLDGE